MRDNRRALGAQGEALATAYLQRNGFRLLAQGWRCRYGEIDLIMLDGDTLVFIEVRTRRSTAAGAPEESLTASKRRRLITLAGAFMQQRASSGCVWRGPWRIDVVAIIMGGQGRARRLSHLKAAVEGDLLAGAS